MNTIKVTVSQLAIEINGQVFKADNIVFEAVDPVTTKAVLSKPVKRRAKINVCPGLGGGGMKCCANAGDPRGTFGEYNHKDAEPCGCQCHNRELPAPITTPGVTPGEDQTL